MLELRHWTGHCRRRRLDSSTTGRQERLVKLQLPLTPTRIIEQAESRYPGRLAVVDPSSDRRFTYEELARRVYSLTALLRSRGIQPGDRVVFLAFNTLELLEGYHAVPRTGAILTPLNVRFSPEELEWILSDCTPRLLFCDPELLGLIGDATARLGIEVIRCGEEYEVLLAEHEPDRGVEAVEELTTCELFYSSGTTGQPKGVELSHRAVYLHALDILAPFSYSGDTVLIHTIPLFHANGWGGAHAAPVVGGTQVMLRRFDPPAVLGVIDREAVSLMFLVPTMLVALLEALEHSSTELPSLQRIFVGGASLAPALASRAVERLGPRVRAAYGLTETAPVLTAGEGSDDPERLVRVGRPVPGVELRVADPQLAPVPRDDSTVGEIVVRGDHLFTAYWGDEAATEAVFAGGWLHTGDLATWDSTGSVRIVDRAKDIVISGGENVSSLEVEAAIAQHPDVLEAAVVGAPDDFWGEIVVAFVVPRQSRQLDVEELQAFLRSHIAHFKVPRRFEVVDALPKSGTGKIQKKDLRTRVQPAAGNRER